MKNNKINHNLSIVVNKHMKQKDNFNYGLFCIKFFDCIVHKGDITQMVDMGQYREKIKGLILSTSKSDNVK